MAKHIVYSTMAQDNIYPVWIRNIGADGKIIVDGRPPSYQVSVVIKGGANVVNQKTLITPMGVATEVDDEQLGHLMANRVFKSQMDAGYITISKAKKEVEKAVKDMTKKDKGAQLEPKDFEGKKQGAKIAPIVDIDGE